MSLKKIKMLTLDVVNMQCSKRHTPFDHKVIQIDAATGLIVKTEDVQTAAYSPVAERGSVSHHTVRSATEGHPQ